MEEKEVKAKDIVKKYNQEQLLTFYNELSEKAKEELLDQILEIDFEKVNRLYETTKQELEIKEDKIEPMKYIDKLKLSEEEKERLEKIGANIISKGEYAVATMAGGQGTRLGHHAPKGTYRLIDDKSLYEIFYESLNRANKKYDCVIPWYIMTSKENNADTLEFFEQNGYFGYPREDVFFFEQNEFPIMDKEGKIFLAEKGLVKQAADGNGGIFGSMVRSGAVEDMKKRGVKWLFIGAIDNALLQMVEPLLVGIAEEENVLAVAKSIVKNSPKEKVGVFCKRNNKPSVIEYTELPEDMANLRDENGELFYGEAHIMCNMFSVSILNDVGGQKLPLHKALKKAEYIDLNGEKIEAKEPNSYKFESFIFDAFETLDDMRILRGVREEDFAPVKNAEGVDSPATARELYINYYKNRKI